MQNHIQSNEGCSGCGACADICAKKAISIVYNQAGVLYPVVDEKKCVGCGACKQICPCCQELHDPEVKHAYIAVGKKKELCERSSSGGIFALAAEAVFSRHGIVYGAVIDREDDCLVCHHIKAEKMEDLRRLQGSKYVHSRTDGVFSEIKRLLEDGTVVLFSGTSCQVAALRLFLKKDYPNLYTVDLVCHGVPELSDFQSYIRYLERRYNCVISDLSFRSKSSGTGKKALDSYILTLQCVDNKTKKQTVRRIPHELSGYFTLFLKRANYRPNCYVCKYASVQKPGDITLGDFKPTPEEMERFSLDGSLTYSSLFVRTDKGMQLLNMIGEDCEKIEIPLDSILKHHKQMKAPSRKTPAGKRLMAVYRLFGYRALETVLKIRKSFR